MELPPDAASGSAATPRNSCCMRRPCACAPGSILFSGSQRPRSQLRLCLFFPLHPQGDSTRVGPLALRSCICYAACQNRLARTAVADPGRFVRRCRTAGIPAAGRIPPSHLIVFAAPRAPSGARPGRGATQAGRRRGGPARSFLKELIRSSRREQVTK